MRELNTPEGWTPAATGIDWRSSSDMLIWPTRRPGEQEKEASSRELRKSMLETYLKNDMNRMLESYENEMITKDTRYLFTLAGRSEDQHKLYTKCVEPKPEFNPIPDGWKTFWTWVEDEQASNQDCFGLR